MLDVLTLQRPEASVCYEFADFRLDPANRELLQRGHPVPLVAKSFDVLLVLVKHSGMLIEKSRLLDSVWADASVEENSLARAIADIRRALGEGPKEHRFIATISGRGYRFLQDVVTVAPRHGRNFAESADKEMPGPSGSAAMTLAVLPFAWLTPRGNDPSLSFGIADAVITRLSNLHQLVVRPTSAILPHAGFSQDLTAVARTLKVNYVITGSIQQAGEHVRVTVQMISADQQRAVWADQFDERFTHLFAVEDSLSARIVAALALNLTNAQNHSLNHSYTKNSEAYQLNLRGRYFLSRRTFEAAQKAIRHFQQAIELDPQYAMPWVGIADTQILIGLHGSLTGWLRPHDAYPEAERAALKALELQPHLAEAHASLGFVYFFYRWDWVSAQREIKQTLLLQPFYANIHHWYSMMCSFMGRHDDALAAIRTALDLEPLSLIYNANRGYILYFARQYPQAIEQLQRTLDLDESFSATHHRLGLAYSSSGLHQEAIDHCLAAARVTVDSPQALGALAYAYARGGETERAQEILRRLVEMSRTRYVSAAIMAEACLGLEQFDQAMEWLEAAVQERTAAILRLRVDPRFDCVRSDPRFQRVIEHTLRNG